MARHLCTGGAGFLGSALVHRLIAEGHEVVVLDRMSRGKMHRLPVGVELIAGDIRDPRMVDHAARGCDVIWHLAYVQGTATFYADPKDVIDVALRGIMNILGACETMIRPPEFFLVSSSEAYQTPPAGMFPTDESVPLSVPDVTNPRYSYGGGKIASELATLAYSQAGILSRAVIVRPHNIYGPDMGWDHVIPQFAERMRETRVGDVDLMLRDGKMPFGIQGTGLETRSFCYIDDAIDGLMVLLDKAEDRGVYHLGNPAEEYRIAKLAHIMAEWFGVEIEVIPGELPKGSPTRRLPDVRKMMALGYDPKVSLREGLVPTLEWYAANERAAA